ncbi:MAG: hypothetical protein P8126_07440 [Gammaproteobacteria bacterium]
MVIDNHRSVLLRLIFCSGFILLFQAAQAQENKSHPETILFANVNFRGYSLLINEIVIKNIKTHKELHLKRYKNEFIHHGFGAKQQNGFVYQTVPAGRYYISGLITDDDMYPDVKLKPSRNLINILSGHINYIGDIIITGKKAGSRWTLEGEKEGSQRILSNEKWSVNVDIIPDIKRVKSVVAGHHSLFAGKDLVFAIPGQRPLLVDPGR